MKYEAPVVLKTIELTDELLDFVADWIETKDLESELPDALSNAIIKFFGED
jgi:hypothetical protein